MATCVTSNSNATTGWDVTLDDLVDTGHRAIILQSVFGTQPGWIAKFPAATNVPAGHSWTRCKSWDSNNSKSGASWIDVNF